MDSLIRGLLIAACSWAACSSRAETWSELVTNPPKLSASAAMPAWPPVAAFASEPAMPTLASDTLTIVHSTNAASGFLVQVDGQTVAVGAMPLNIGYVTQGEVHWLENAGTNVHGQQVAQRGPVLFASYDAVDPDGATWRVRRQFRATQTAGAIEVETEISVDQDRAVAFLPMLLLFPGVGSFGPDKHQALFSGLEYLDNEPSSSEADVVGPSAQRQVPDTEKITLPLMAVQSQDRYVALTWQMRPFLSAVFDSPDRLFHSGGHVLGLLFPGSDGKNREEGKLLPRVTEPVRAGSSLRARATIMGGKGQSIVPAVQQYCRLRPLPPLPPAPESASYAALAAQGWLHSAIREGNLIRHALAANGFKAQPAADAALWMEWLAGKSSDPASAAQLYETSSNVLSAVPPAEYKSAGVGHIRYPAPSLVFGHVPEAVDLAQSVASGLLGSFETDGSRRYRPQPGGTDFGKTHFTNEASGFTAEAVAELLENSAFSGDKKLIDSAVARLRDMRRFHGGVPRGAQTWECPLHTPDILAAAHLVRAYSIGYELTGDSSLLEEARYWAWSGVPFVYLVNPTDKPVGLYSTIAVYGATQWRAPVWFGLPVQWCGLVYADALYRLHRFDPQPIWKQLADGITISGMQQTWPEEEQQYHGLLPDSFVLRDQKRNGPAINPATVAACASRFYGSPVCDFRGFRQSGVLAYAPGTFENITDKPGHLSFTVKTWVKHPYSLLLNNLGPNPRVSINSKPTGLHKPDSGLLKSGGLVLQLEGDSAVELSW